MSLTPTAPPTGDPWHRVDVCNSSALARTRVSLIGVLDDGALDTIEEAVDLAEEHGRTITFDLVIASIDAGVVAPAGGSDAEGLRDPARRAACPAGPVSGGRSLRCDLDRLVRAC